MELKHKIILTFYDNGYLPTLNFDYGTWTFSIGSFSDSWSDNPMRFRMMKWNMDFHR